MNTKFLLSPAYLVSIAALIVGAILAGTTLMVVGWIIFIVGLALNALALVILVNRDFLKTTPAVAPTATSSAASTGEKSKTATPRNPRKPSAQKNSQGKITDSYRANSLNY